MPFTAYRTWALRACFRARVIRQWDNSKVEILPVYYKKFLLYAYLKPQLIISKSDNPAQQAACSDWPCVASLLPPPPRTPQVTEHRQAVIPALLVAACGSVWAVSHIWSLRAERFGHVAGNFNFLKQIYGKEPINANLDRRFSAVDVRGRSV